MRGGRGGSAVMVIECDQPAGHEAEEEKTVGLSDKGG